MINIPITFINQPTRDFYECEARHACISGGFGSGKTVVACNKALTLLTQFDNYRMLFGRLTYKDLKQTTMKTFYKLCPRELYDVKNNGRRSDIEGVCRFINGSEILFVHLDEFDEKTLRGIELNAAFLDQAEELSEGIIDTLGTRLGRWDKARPNKSLLRSVPDWPRDEQNRFKIPAYLMLAVNPEDETHHIYRKYHPDSLEHQNNYPDYAYFEVSSADNPFLDKETLKVMMSRDPQWVKRFVHGQWGISEASVHHVLPESIIDPPKEWIENLLKNAMLYRTYDHGESSAACMLWWASYKGSYYCYREYYQEGTLISEHRKNMAYLSGDEVYVYSLADPEIFRIKSQKNGNFWCTADEYTDRQIPAAPINFQPADNNELTTRNRINEYLRYNTDCTHPLTNESPAPKIYFIERNEAEHNYGCFHAIQQLRSQRRLRLGTMNGRDIYGEERDGKIVDHAYDPIRYFVASHAQFPGKRRVVPKENSFFGAQKRLKALKVSGKYTQFGDFIPRGLRQ
jgi:phage terminase large subunit